MADDRAIPDVEGVGDASSTRPGGIPGLDEVVRALRGIRFGEVRVIVQDGLIVQIERLEKQRLR